MSDRAASRSRSPCREIPAPIYSSHDAFVAEVRQGVIDNLRSTIQYKADIVSILEEDKKRLTLRVRDLEHELKTKTMALETELKTANIRLQGAYMMEDWFRKHLNMPLREESSQ